MVNVESQSNRFVFENNRSGYLPKMSSSANLYDLLTTQSSISNDDSDNDLSSETNLITMTSSISNDSAIVIDDLNDKHIKYRNSWPKMIEKNEIIYHSFSQSFELLNQFEQQTIYDNEISISKYKHPLPWINHPTSFNKVHIFIIKIKIIQKSNKKKYKLLTLFFSL